MSSTIDGGGTLATIRFVDVLVTEPRFMGDESPRKLVEPAEAFQIAAGEQIVGAETTRHYSGSMGHDEAIGVRVWIVASEWIDTTSRSS